MFNDAPTSNCNQEASRPSPQSNFRPSVPLSTKIIKEKLYIIFIYLLQSSPSPSISKFSACLNALLRSKYDVPWTSVDDFTFREVVSICLLIFFTSSSTIFRGEDPSRDRYVCHQNVFYQKVSDLQYLARCRCIGRYR